MTRPASNDIRALGFEDRNLHNSIAQTYDDKYRYVCARKYLDYEVCKLIANIGKMNEVILDIGCGTGILMPYIKKYCNQYIGIDQSDEMIRSARKKYETSSFIIGEAKQLPFRDNSISTIICRGSLHHMSDPNIALCEFNRILEMRGKLILVEPNNLNIIIQVLRQIMTKIDRGYSSKQRQFNPTELINLLEGRGFREISIQYIGYISNLFERPDKFILAKYVNEDLFEKVIQLDDSISKCSLISKYSWGLIISAAKD